MARSVNLTADLEPRDSDVAIPDLLFPKIPPFSDLKSTAKLANFPGAVILRRFRKGEVICRQGDPGWTAFYIPTSGELEAVREAPRTQLTVAEGDLTKAETKVGDLEKQLTGAAGDAKKSDSLKGKLAEAKEQVVEIKERIAILRLAIPSMEKAINAGAPDEESAALLAAGDAAMKGIREAMRQADALGDEEGSARLRSLIEADTTKKRTQAYEIASADPQLARWLNDIADAEVARKVASVHLTIQLPRAKAPKTLLSRIGAVFTKKKRKRPKRRPSTIPIDGPRDLDYETREGVLNEGELFGEMSCLYRAPRSATVTASRDCYMLEMLRNVLEAMNRDAGFKSRLDQLYRERVLRLQLRNLPILLELDERQLDRLRQSAELVEVPSGALLYDQNEPSDSMHLIRGGIIKVMRDASYLLGESDITDWPSLGADLSAGSDSTSGFKHQVWSLLPASARKAITLLEDDGFGPGSRRIVLDALNELIKNPGFDGAAGLRDLALTQRVGRKAWQRLAEPARASELEMLRCQRLLIDSIYGNKLPEWKPDESADEPSYDYRAGDIRDWKAAATALVEGSTKQGEPKGSLWNRLGEPARALLTEAKTGGEPPDEGKETVIQALNAILRTRPLILEPEFQDYVKTKKPAKLLMEFLPSKGWEEYDFHRGSRAYNRFLLDLISPKGLGTSRRPEGPPRVLAYRSRGETIGESSLLEGKPRLATCVAYGHPDNDPDREGGAIQLVRISRELFDELKESSRPFLRYLENLVAERKAQHGAETSRAGRTDASTAPRPGRTEELGLLQGKRLMLIDLDRCTRCDECVQACVDTHDDGRSRLFLDGPRFGKYLVPTTCRSCLDPVCMIGCPVGSIHRGNNGEILIEDWCIGCEACASQCPYGAIQMHKDGIIPESSFGWRYALAANLPDDWPRGGGRDRDWHVGSAPFVLDREFRSLLDPSRNGAGQGTDPIAFRYDFDVERELLNPESHFILSLTTMDEGINVWINGKPIVASAEQTNSAEGVGASVSRKKSRDYGWWEVDVEMPPSALKAGKNSVAVSVTPSSGGSDRLLDLRLDRDEGATVKLVEQKAVVCDLCSAQAGQRPACVTACPHEAAIRIDALSQLSSL
jgi:Fe-S-cluster-containing hydrogenase component 2/CRP-like cAMP-binding protein